ncbi:tyrosine-type recombinase/integrase [Amphibacillus jilinensis]|uniref:site-specific integrase n=1 Tax=Amphibacillus jilinensis TaxID=1216008 RepID=UPI0002F52B8D|nr:tyrosine-type recombinase/integrase [Amphibacillus jilinensis]
MTVYKDKKRGTYYYSAIVDLPNGERKRYMKRGFKTKKEAKNAEIEFLYNFEVEDEENLSFGQIADMYLSWYKKRRKASSYTKIESIVRVHLMPRFEHKKIKDIIKRDIVRFHDHLLDHLSVVSAKKVHTVLSAVLNYAISLEYLRVNVAREVGNIDIKVSKNIDFWTIDEFKEFIAVVDDLMFQTFFMVLFYGGLRKGEALALTWNDIDFDNNIIDINKTVYHGRITSPKNESSVRKIKMPQHTMNLLGELKLQSKIKMDYVVFGTFKDHIAHTTIDRYFHQYIEQVEVKRIRIHDFRHSHASYLISLGNDIQIVSKRLGHANTSTTYDIYSHLYPNAEDDAIAQMEEDFKPASVVKISDYK